jgi:UDP-glucose 4-epimerase
MPNVLVTGGAGFFGGILKQRLLQNGFHPRLKNVTGDVRDRKLVEQTFAAGQFDAVFHCAAALAYGNHKEREELWATNVEATRLLAETARRHDATKLVFLSTHCLWSKQFGRPVNEVDAPKPPGAYGESKLAAERLLAQFADDMDVTVLRCPTIIDRGRLGLLAILFEFIQENKTVWVVGEGANRSQFIYGEDLANACLLALRATGFNLFHVGSDNVPTLRQTYEAVIQEAGSKSQVRSLPTKTALGIMRMAHRLHLSPLGPYHYSMIAEDFAFDTSRIKEKLKWRPTLTNDQMLTRAYRYYARRSQEIHAPADTSDHARSTSMGVIRLLKWVS